MRHRFFGGLTALAAAAAMLFLMDASASAQGKNKGKRRPPLPTPHWEDGTVRLGPLAGEKGVWNGSAGTNLLRSRIDNGVLNLPTNLPVGEVPFQPWARALFDLRTERLTADDPHVRCKASGGPRLYTTPYGFEFVEFRDLKRIYVMGVGGPHTWRLFYMDGRSHPKDLDPSFYGHSVGRYEGGDTLVVDTVGFNERFWISREGPPHTEQLHLIERFTRIDSDNLRYEATIDDPGAYTKPWSGGWMIPWGPNAELYEFICQENNRDVRHMFGGEAQ